MVFTLSWIISHDWLMILLILLSEYISIVSSKKVLYYGNCIWVSTMLNNNGFDEVVRVIYDDFIKFNFGNL